MLGRTMLLALLAALCLSACGGDDEPPSETCPAAGSEPKDGEACNHAASLQCTGSEVEKTCYGSTGQSRTCSCVGGAWVCPNLLCPGFCPSTLKEALKGPACTVAPGEEQGTCNFKDSAGSASVVCTCAGGKVDCL